MSNQEGEPLSQEELINRLNSMGAQATHVIEGVAEEAPVDDELGGGYSEPEPEDVLAMPEPQEEPPEAEKEDDKEEEEAKSITDVMKQNAALPTAEIQEQLRQKYAKYGDLTVVPLMSETKDGKIISVILRPLTRMEWRKSQEWAAAQERGSQGAKSFQEFFEERIVSLSLVWPNVPSNTYEGRRAGLVPTLYNVTERISWFFDVPTLLNYTFTI